jgi:ubiquinone/menaquinone biosynthesis C-methylase UbiE
MRARGEALAEREKSMARKVEPQEEARTYIPAAGHDLFLPFYDPFVKLLGGDAARRTLVDQAGLRPRHRVLDIGCGTGTLATLIKRLYPDVDVVGLDPDPKALARARGKAGRAGVSIAFDQGFADALPYPAASFDRVVSSLMFHHLAEDEKEKTLREVRRVLKPGGTLHLLDFGGAEHAADGLLSRWVHSSHRLSDNSEGRILALMGQAGFADPKTVDHRHLLFGRIVYYRAGAPAA